MYCLFQVVYVYKNSFLYLYYFADWPPNLATNKDRAAGGLDLVGGWAEE